MCETSPSSDLRSTDPKAKINQHGKIFFKTVSRYNATLIFSLKALLGQEGREGVRKPGEMNSTFMTACRGSICIERFSSM